MDMNTLSPDKEEIEEKRAFLASKGFNVGPDGKACAKPAESEDEIVLY